MPEFFSEHISDQLLLAGLILVTFLLLRFLWRTRRTIWFVILFVAALAAIYFYETQKAQLELDFPWLGTALLIGGSLYAAYRFAKKRS